MARTGCSIAPWLNPQEVAFDIKRKHESVLDDKESLIIVLMCKSGRDRTPAIAHILVNLLRSMRFLATGPSSTGSHSWG